MAECRECGGVGYLTELEAVGDGLARNRVRCSCAAGQAWAMPDAGLANMLRAVLERPQNWHVDTRRAAVLEAARRLDARAEARWLAVVVDPDAAPLCSRCGDEGCGRWAGEVLCANCALADAAAERGAA